MCVYCSCWCVAKVLTPNWTASALWDPGPGHKTQADDRKTGRPHCAVVRRRGARSSAPLNMAFPAGISARNVHYVHYVHLKHQIYLVCRNQIYFLFFLGNLFLVLACGAWWFLWFLRSSLLVAPGSWLLLTPGGSWWLLVAPGGSWWLLVAPGGSWWLLVASVVCGFCGFCGFYGSWAPMAHLLYHLPINLSVKHVHQVHVVH